MTIPFLVLGSLLAALALAVAFGGPSTPPAMGSINDRFKSIDRADLPAVQTYAAADGQALAYREYAPAAPATLAAPVQGSVTLIHGSSASSDSMHVMAKAFSASGWRVYALDMRGHGQSGVKGQIDYIGQLESDMEAFVRTVRPPTPSTLAGFSSGGGFVLRLAGSPRGILFDSYLLMSPFISQDSPTHRPDSGGWVRVGLPRIVGLTMLNAVGIRAFNHLPVTRFALNDEAKALLTPEYGFNLSTTFRPQADYMANLRAVDRPTAVLAGATDEAFRTDQLEPVIRQAGQKWPVKLLPGVAHIPLILEPSALEEAVRMVRALQAPG